MLGETEVDVGSYHNSNGYHIRHSKEVRVLRLRWCVCNAQEPATTRQPTTRTAHPLGSSTELGASEQLPILRRRDAPPVVLCEVAHRMRTVQEDGAISGTHIGATTPSRRGTLSTDPDEYVGFTTAPIATEPPGEKSTCRGRGSGIDSVSASAASLTGGDCAPV